MIAWLRSLGWIADRAISVLVWLHDSIMLFVCLLWLLPLIALVVVSAFVYDLRPVLREHMQGIFLYSLLGLPLWLGVCLYAELAATSTSRRVKAWMQRMPGYVGYVLLGAGGLLWLLGII